MAGQMTPGPPIHSPAIARMLAGHFARAQCAERVVEL